MARRLHLAHDKETREKIRTSQLINRLENSVLPRDGRKRVLKIDRLDAVQVNAIKVLLMKALPDLQQVQLDVAGAVTVEVLTVAKHKTSK